MGEGKGTGGDWRTSNRRPSAFGGARREPEALEPPTMSRSRVQLASSYAPGVLMTWEGGKGICRSVPLANDISKRLNRTTIDLVFENLSDFATNWRARAMKAVPDALPELVLDAPFRDSRTGEVRIERGDFQMTGPDRVGYVPYPLVYRCGICGSTREYESIADQARQPLPRKCNGHDARWTQVDVVYVHWSGEIQPLSPFNYNFDPQTGSTRQIRMCTCGSTSFKLRNDAPVFSEWRYVCEGCGDTRPLKKAEPEVLARLQTEQNTSGRAFQWIEINMLPVSYRANSTFYPQRTSFIEFQDSAVVELLTPTRVGELVAKLAQIHNIPFAEPAEDEVRAAVQADPKYRSDWDDYLSFLGTKRPIYVTQQQNEALYFKLDEARVVRWLKANMVTDVPDDGLGRGYLERYEDFGPFLEMFKDREGSGGYPRTVPAYVYQLLHTLSHQMMHSLADSSGVDRDGIGEHIFPADLAFVIYRKGMTPDLGNISAMWRNHADEFLRRALDPRMLRCGSGTLCDARGGACPACVMVSEVSCIASNLLLSRAVLKGGKGPEWEPRSAPDLVGFFDAAVAT